MSLISKIQLKDYEPGEFSASQPRTWPETLDLITQFPWTEQRENLLIGLTNPSITIEGPSDDFLKLATYYHDKYILYYLDKTNHLYTLPVSSLQDAYPILQSFFSSSPFISAGFKKNFILFKNNKGHFETRQFTYTMRLSRILLSTELFALLFCPMPSVMLMFAPHIEPGKLLMILPIVLIIMIPACIIIAQIINHVRRSRNKILTISRGESLFSFGKITAPVTYDKKDISDILIYHASKDTGRLKRTEIIFNDGSSINISGIMIDQSTLQSKFPHNTCQRISKSFSFIPADTTSPRSPSSSPLF